MARTTRTTKAPAKAPAKAPKQLGLFRRAVPRLRNRQPSAARPAYSQRAQPKPGDTIRLLDPRTRNQRERPVFAEGIIVAVDSPLARYGNDQALIYRLTDEPEEPGERPITRIAMPQDVLFAGEDA